MKGVDAIASQYALDEGQREALKKDILKRYPELLKRHRVILQPIVNEIVEMDLAEEKPTAEQVAVWAGALEPVMADVRKAIRATYEELKPMLQPDQKIRWDRDFAHIWVGVGLVQAQLTRWKQGMFKPDEWPPRFASVSANPSSAHASVGTQPAMTQPTETAPGLQVAEPSTPTFNRFVPKQRESANERRVKASVVDRSNVSPDQWESYVRQFIRQHDLDRGQINQAMAILKDVRTRARQYREQSRHVIDEAETDRPYGEGRGRIVASRDEDLLREQLRDLFEELRDRLDGILRSSQRQAAADR